MSFLLTFDAAYKTYKVQLEIHIFPHRTLVENKKQEKEKHTDLRVL